MRIIFFFFYCHTSSSLYNSSGGVDRGSVLGLMLFIMHTTPLRTLVSSHCPNHHLSAYDTQLFFSFHPPTQALQNALQHISFWMTANLLTLSSSKTEFLLIGLKKQLDKIHNCSRNITHSACNLGFSSLINKHLTFLDQISTHAKSCYYHIRQLVPLPPPSFTPNPLL